MSLNRAYVKAAAKASLTGLGATQWLRPRVRWAFLLAWAVWGIAIGIFGGALGLETRTALFMAGNLVFLFVLYDFVVSYLLLERRDREGELAVASRIQAGLFPTSVPQGPRFSCAGHTRPARVIGGDYWDVTLDANGRPLLLVIDVAGKGVPAALLMAGLRSQFHLLARQHLEPAQIVGELNRVLVADTGPGEFATLLLVSIDTETETLTAVNAGHPAGLLIHADGSYEELASAGLPVGMLDGVPHVPQTVAWSAGDRLVLFSDGLQDVAMDAESDGLSSDAIARCAHETRSADPDRICEALPDLATERARGMVEDDVTVLVCTFS
ncbi:MAG: PP2C family protein-serine/threonine phosphatase [Candidatus Eisenbacteria bacterium]